MLAPEAHGPPSQTRRRRYAWLAMVVVAWGVQAVVTQSLLLREALVLMFGSEFAWGVVLFAWLFGVAVGGVVGGWWAQRLSRADLGLALVLVGLGVTACVELWVFRGARAWLGVEPGELLPLPKTALAAVLFVSPAGALVGMAFPFACCIHNGRATKQAAANERPGEEDTTRRPLMQLPGVYALESAGSLIGGAAFSFWAVEHLTPIQTALSCGALTSVALAGFLATQGRGTCCSVSRRLHSLRTATVRERQCFALPRPLPNGRGSDQTGLDSSKTRHCGVACAATLAVAAAAASMLAGNAWERKLVHRRWRQVAPGYELCAEEESKYQNLAVGRRAGQYTLYANGKVTADFPDPYTFAPLAHFWLCQHPAPRVVLVLGGGAEGLLAEILRHPVEHVDYVEPDARQIALIEPYLPEADRQALTDPRVTVHHADARHFAKTQTDRFDLVIARLPEPTSALHARFYTEEFYGELDRAMTRQSVLCLTAAATPGQLSAASAEYLASIRATLRRHFPHTIVGWGNPAHLLAATSDGLTSSNPTTLTKRYEERRVQSEWFHPAWFDGAVDWFDPDKIRVRAAELDAVRDPEISTDLRPAVYMQRLALWERMTGDVSSGVTTGLRSIGWFEVLAALALIAATTVLACRLSGRGAPRPPSQYAWLARSAIVLTVGATGFATMALSIIWLFAFQSLYGYVYQRIGWIIAMFMAGLVLGCGVADWRSKRWPNARTRMPYLWRRLIHVDVLIAALALAIPFVLPALGRLQHGPIEFAVVEWCISLLVAATGALGGATFALAGALQLEATGRPGAAAGSVVGADHAGACLGALLSGTLLVPVFGIAATAFLLAGIKLSSAAFLLVGRRVSRAD